MKIGESYQDLVKRKANEIMRHGPGLERIPGIEAADAPPATKTLAAGLESSGAPGGMPTAGYEAVIRWYRPVLQVRDDRFITPQEPGRFEDPNMEASKQLLKALEDRRGVLDPAIRSVGRIELKNNAHYPWVGTGWIIACELGNDIVVTNAHVAREFAMRSAGGFVFRPGIPNYADPQAALIDFREELGASNPREFAVTEVIWISEVPSLDVAVLRVARTSGEDRIDPPIGLHTGELPPARALAVIGYPGSNNGYDPERFERLFGRITGAKRFSPGFYGGRRAESITYDCSTIPGSSGSIVLDVETGRAVGLHFAGTAFDTNYAVPAVDLERILRKRPWQPEGRAAREPLRDRVAADARLRDNVRTTFASSNPKALTVTVPIDIVVRIGDPQPIAADTSVAPAGARASAAARTLAEAAAMRVRQHLLGDSRVLKVTTGQLFKDGELTDELGVILHMAPGSSLDASEYGIERHLDGVEIALESADPETILAEQFGLSREAFSGRHAEYRRDLKDKRFNLAPVEEAMTLVLHVSPEAGWPVLKQFLERKDCDRLTVGMYHMTAPHIVETIKGIAARPSTHMKLTLDRQRGDLQKDPDDTSGATKAKDIPERDTLKALKDIAGTRFQWAPASLGAHGLFPTAYHIKVAVWSKQNEGHGNEDAFWLSSGNWQSSNQARLDQSPVAWEQVADYNREWHAVVEHAGLARTLRNHLEQDYEDNRAAAGREAPVAPLPYVLVPEALLERPRRPSEFRSFSPMKLQGRIKVQVLLTPDNYPEIVAKLISSARKRVLVQNQSFTLWSKIETTPEHFLKIAEALKERQRAGLDVRIIFRSGYGGEVETLRRLKRFGLKADAAHVRYFDTCHTKGIVIDDDVVVLGSHNWTAAGTGPNRDASLVVWHPNANAYFAELFDYDWEQVAERRVRSRGGSNELVRIVAPGAEVPDLRGYRRVSLAEFLGET